MSVDQQDMVLHCFFLHDQIKMHHFNNHWLMSFGYPRLYVTSQTWDYMSLALSCHSSQMVQCPILLGQRLRCHGSQGKRWRSHTFEKMWTFCCSFKELEDAVAMCFLGFADCWKKSMSLLQREQQAEPAVSETLWRVRTSRFMKFRK